MKRQIKKLMKKEARAIALRELGTAAGLEKQIDPCDAYELHLGNITALIRLNLKTEKVELHIWMRDGAGESCTVFDRQTLEPEYKELTHWRREEWETALRSWVRKNGPEKCCEEVKKIWLSF